MQTRQPRRSPPAVDSAPVRAETAQARPSSAASSAGSRWPASTRTCWSRPARQLLCSCEPCAILFSGQQGGRYRRVPRDIESLPDFRLSDAQWEDLHLPINLAFFVESTPARAGARTLPEPGRRHRVALDARGLAGPGGREPRAARARAGRRGTAGQPDEGRAQYITARPSTNATSWSA